MALDGPGRRGGPRIPVIPDLPDPSLWPPGPPQPLTPRQPPFLPPSGGFLPDPSLSPELRGLFGMREGVAGGLPLDYEALLRAEPLPALEPESGFPGGARGVISRLMLALSEALSERPGFAAAQIAERERQAMEAKERNIGRTERFKTRVSGIGREGVEARRREKETQAEREARAKQAELERASREEIAAMRAENQRLQAENQRLNYESLAQYRTTQAATAKERAETAGEEAARKKREGEEKPSAIETNEAKRRSEIKDYMAQALMAVRKDERGAVRIGTMTFGGEAEARKALLDYLEAQIAGDEDPTWAAPLREKINLAFEAAPATAPQAG